MPRKRLQTAGQHYGEGCVVPRHNGEPTRKNSIKENQKRGLIAILSFTSTNPVDIGIMKGSTSKPVLALFIKRVQFLLTIMVKLVRVSDVRLTVIIIMSER